MLRRRLIAAPAEPGWRRGAPAPAGPAPHPPPPPPAPEMARRGDPGGGGAPPARRGPPRPRPRHRPAPELGRLMPVGGAGVGKAAVRPRVSVSGRPRQRRARRALPPGRALAVFGPALPPT